MDKKKTGLLALLILIGAQAFAQVQFNPKFGFNYSSIDRQVRDFTANARSGWNAGVDFRMGNHFIYFAPGLHYYNNTTELVSAPGFGDNLRGRTRVHSLKLPARLAVGGIFGLYAKAGLVPTYVLGVKQEDNFDFDRGDLEPFTLGADLGIGWDIAFLTLEANYEFGLTDYFKSVNGRNNVLTFSAGLRF